MIFMLQLIMLGWLNHVDRGSRICSTLREIKNACSNSLLILNQRENMEDVRVDGKVTLQ
jgi:hypothetical protein